MNKLKLVLLFIGGMVLFFLPIILNIWVDIWKDYKWLYFVWYGSILLLFVLFLVVRRLRKKSIIPEIVSKPEITLQQAEEIGKFYGTTNPDIGDNLIWKASETITAGKGSNQNDIAYIKFQLWNKAVYFHFWINLNKPTKLTKIISDLNNIATNPHQTLINREYIKEVANLLVEPQKIKERTFKRYDTETGLLKEEVTQKQPEEEAKAEEEEAEKVKELEF